MIYYGKIVNKIKMHMQLFILLSILGGLTKDFESKAPKILSPFLNDFSLEKGTCRIKIILQVHMKIYKRSLKKISPLIFTSFILISLKDHFKTIQIFYQDRFLGVLLFISIPNIFDISRLIHLLEVSRLQT